MVPGQSTGMWSPGRKMEACRILLYFHEKGQKGPKEDTEHEIQTSDKLIWCFHVLRASPAAAATTTRRGCVTLWPSNLH